MVHGIARRDAVAIGGRPEMTVRPCDLQDPAIARVELLGRPGQRCVRR